MLLALTASHKTADFDTLEALSRVDPTSLADRLRAHEEISGAVVLSTCNRFEVYVDAASGFTQELAIDRVRGALAEQGILVPLSCDLHVDQEAAEHLFSVASGLESVVVGEGEIAGQVRRAHRRAQELQTTSSDLERLFQRANETQRIVKRKANVGEANRSVIRMALDLATTQIRSWEDARVLLVGTGNYAATTLKALRERHVQHVEVWSPSGRQSEFATKYGIDRVDARDLHVSATLADVIVTCSSAEDYAISAELLSRGRDLGLVNGAKAPVCPVTASCDTERPLQVIIDMGLPRNVNPDVKHVPGVSLLDLETVRLHAPLDHLVTTDTARDHVRKAARTFIRVSDENRLSPAVVALREHVHEALEAELQRVRRRGTEEEQRATEQALRHFAGVILHKPSVRARELAASGRHDDFITGLDALFGLEA
ncbi:glutamyl-tRNA reductase [uncultured Agrococcus sp.]|uniref:glutamyl-tRNA reductase n=1 Tax=uncultured Agrococcus sp. TaxID=382258 RepID=UPI0025D378F4|nr:glutamyl-tRNA reductase [uncultured Agrococcus sp.]